MFLICCAKRIKYRLLFISLFTAFLLVSCVTSPPPSDVNHICSLFKHNRSWARATKDVERRWRVPVAIQMAIIHQESKFDAHARPPRTKLLKVIPLKRPSSAYGYTQALSSTWSVYKKTNGSILSSRTNFAAGVDFIGWYANQAYRTAGIPRTDAYSLYLAYHEGVGGYQRKTYLKKPWLMGIAKRVQAQAALYSSQLRACQ